MKFPVDSQPLLSVGTRQIEELGDLGGQYSLIAPRRNDGNKAALRRAFTADRPKQRFVVTLDDHLPCVVLLEALSAGRSQPMPKFGVIQERGDLAGQIR